MISRRPSLILPLACRIPGVTVKGPEYAVGMPTERETFGEVRVWLEFHLPGQGPLARLTSTPKFLSNFPPLARFRRDGSKENSTSNNGPQAGLELEEMVEQLDLYVMSNCSVDRAEMIVSECMESEMENFTVSRPVLEKGCMMSNNILEIIKKEKTFKIYRLDLSRRTASGTKMYVECKLNLCIATRPSDTCPDLCGNSSSSSMLVDSVFTSTYSVRSGPVSLLVKDFMNRNESATAEPANNTDATPTNNTLPTSPKTPTPTSAPGSTPPASQIPSMTTTNNIATGNTTLSQAPEVATSSITGVILMTITIFLQMNIIQ